MSEQIHLTEAKATDRDQDSREPGRHGPTLQAKRSLSDERTPPERANECWSFDVVPLQIPLTVGKTPRLLTIVDDFTREVLVAQMGSGFTGIRIVLELDALVRRRGTPERVISHCGEMFNGSAIERWLSERDVVWCIASTPPSKLVAEIINRAIAKRTESHSGSKRSW